MVYFLLRATTVSQIFDSILLCSPLLFLFCSLDMSLKCLLTYREDIQLAFKMAYSSNFAVRDESLKIGLYARVVEAA